MKFTKKQRLSSLLVGAASVALLAACSSGAPAPGNGSNDNGNGSDEPANTAPEKSSLTVAINPSSQFTPMFYGMDSGIFKDHGLELEIVPQTDVAAIISGIASGQYDFGFATVVHVVTANANNIPIRTVSTIEGQYLPDEEGTITIASKASGIKSFADMAGKRLATVGLSSNNTITSWALAEEAGIDPKSIELVQLPFGQMAAALASGDVDAAVMQWPFAGDALNDGGVQLAYNNRVIYADSATTFFNTSQPFIDKNPNTVKAFAEAMIDSINAANDNPDKAKESLIPHMGLTAEQAKDARWNIGGKPYVSLKAFDVAQAMLAKYSSDQAAAAAIEKLDVKSLVYPGAMEN